MNKLNLPDIQGLILRGYRLPFMRYFLLMVNNEVPARNLLSRLAIGLSDIGIKFTTAEDWHVSAPGPHDDLKSIPKAKPDYCLNVGITWPGLIALGLKDHIPAIPSGSFDAFVEGAAKRASSVGDTGADGPENWVGGFGSGKDHVMFSLWALNPEALEKYSHTLTTLFLESDAFSLLWHKDGSPIKFDMQNGNPVPVPVVHFGYMDGITSTPRIKGGPEPVTPDHQKPCDPWLFILGDDAENYQLPKPAELWKNGSFGVFKMVKQDVAGFEKFLESNRDQIDPELLAAKLCGRWRNGVPLSLSPDTDMPSGGIKADQLNNFEYVSSDGSGDHRGLVCPVGAHTRRMNPRGQPIAGQGKPGGSNNTHRLIRRGVPYGPAYDPMTPEDGIERGLLGYFINTYIENQYEFVLKEWSESGEFAGRVRLNPKSMDPLIAKNDPKESIFEIPRTSAPPLKITGFKQFISTQAAAYCFLPSMAALRWIGSIGK